jgi:hypothetical protein
MVAGDRFHGAARPRSGAGLLVGVALAAAVAAVALGVAGSSPRSVVVMGDSLMAESAGAVGAYLDFQGDAVHPSALAGSGLLDTEVDWIGHARQLVALYDPKIVVVEFSGDYGFLGTRPGIAPFTPAFYDAWRGQSQKLEDILTSRGARVYWVVGPPVANPINNASIFTLDHVYATLHAPNEASGHPPLIEVGPALTGGTGRYTEFLPGPNGQPVQVRQPDGTHFTIYGVALFARAIAQAVS